MERLTKSEAKTSETTRTQAIAVLKGERRKAKNETTGASFMTIARTSLGWVDAYFGCRSPVHGMKAP